LAITTVEVQLASTDGKSTDLHAPNLPKAADLTNPADLQAANLQAADLSDPAYL
jgi:hypothetical protein